MPPVLSPFFPSPSPLIVGASLGQALPRYGQCRRIPLSEAGAGKAPRPRRRCVSDRMVASEPTTKLAARQDVRGAGDPRDAQADACPPASKGPPCPGTRCPHRRPTTAITALRVCSAEGRAAMPGAARHAPLAGKQCTAGFCARHTARCGCGRMSASEQGSAGTMREVSTRPADIGRSVFAGSTT